jgi:fibro-slime domain-containing protein
MFQKFTIISVLLLAQASFPALKVHLYDPWLGDPTRIAPPAIITIDGRDVGSYPGSTMTAEGNNWHGYTFLKDPPDARDDFKFNNYIPAPNNPYSKRISYDNAGKDFTMGQVFLSRGASEVWIIPQGLGLPPLITDIPPGAKAVYIFNPWPETAPAIRVGRAMDFSRMRISDDRQRCGWYLHYFPAKEYSVSFKSLVGNEWYGAKGLGSQDILDLSPFFVSSDTIYLLPDPIPGGSPKILTTFPSGTTSICSFPLAVTIRDFSAKHPDFEEGGMGGNLTKNMVQPNLAPDKKPVQGTAFYYQKYFDKWFRTDSTNINPDLRNYESCLDLPISKDNYGYWAYDSYNETSHSFFPVDLANRFNETYQSHYRDRSTGNYITGSNHNFHFCMEMHANFKYRQGQVFRFSGDDDVWVFIDNKLAIDLGGTHSPETDSVAMDSLGLSVGNKYDFDLFYCERKTLGSNLLMQTSIFFEQNQSVFAKLIPLLGGKTQYDIYEILSGDKSCGSAKDGDTVLAKSLFKLSGPSINPPVELPAGVSFGGVVVNTGRTQVIVDTAKVTGLRPGLYTVTYTSERSGKGSTLQFMVKGSLMIEFLAKPPTNSLLDTPVPITVHAILNGVADKRMETFKLITSTGLLAFEDSSLTKPLDLNKGFSTEIATGEKQIWVTANLPGTYKLDLMGGLVSAINMDSYANLTFYAQPKASKPIALPAGRNFSSPLNVTLRTSTAGANLYYTLDGTDPAAFETGSTKRYTGTGLVISTNTTLKVWATINGFLNSDILVESYVYTPPINFLKGWYADINGDGQIESAFLKFSEELPFLPEAMDFKIIDQVGRAATHLSLSSIGEIQYASGSKSLLMVSFKQSLLFGITSVANDGDAVTLFNQGNLSLVSGKFSMADSLAPVIYSAEVREPDSTQPLKRILITYSEKIQSPSGPLNSLAFKRDDEEISIGKVRILRVEAIGNFQSVFYVDSLSDIFPIAGDSVAIYLNGETKDLVGNTPIRRLYKPLLGALPKPIRPDLFITFPNGLRNLPVKGSEPPSQTEVRFIAISQDGSPLPGTGKDRCISCPSQQNGIFVGPMFNIVTPGPMAYDFKVFTTTGIFVVQATGRIDIRDLLSLKRSNGPKGLLYQARIVWTGRAESGEKVGTGTYILTSILKTDRDPKNGAQPAVVSKKLIFGLLRSFAN